MIDGQQRKVCVHCVSSGSNLIFPGIDTADENASLETIDSSLDIIETLLDQFPESTAEDTSNTLSEEDLQSMSSYLSGCLSIDNSYRY